MFGGIWSSLEAYVMVLGEFPVDFVNVTRGW